MPVNVELIVLDPARSVDVEWRAGQLPGQHRSQMKPAANQCLQSLEKVPAVGLGQPKDRERTDMHRNLGCLQVQIGRIHHGQLADGLAHLLLWIGTVTTLRAHELLSKSRTRRLDRKVGIRIASAKNRETVELFA